MINYDPAISPLIYLKLSSPGVSQYEFDTFIVGKYHSRARLIQGLLRKKQEILQQTDSILSNFGIDMYDTLMSLDSKSMIDMIDIELSKYDINDITDLENEESNYWVNELARTSALEINTYGRIRPDTMDKLMLLSEECYIQTMNKASLLANKLQYIAETTQHSSESAHIVDAPIPPNLPII